MTSIATVAAQNSAAATTSSTSVSAALVGTTTAASNGLASLSSNFSEFLNLLMTQLKNQDPTSPMDTNSFTQELVEFSEVEQQINTNSSLGTLIQLTQSGQLLQGSSIIGKTVEVSTSTGQVPLVDSSATIAFTAASPGTANLTIKNSAGAVVATETIAATQGSNTYTWDGEGADGSTEPDGTYTFSLTGPTNTGTIGSNLTFDVIGAASGVTDNSGTIDLQIGSLTTPFTNVQAVGN
jgi:flagellar basal-body rod modification protein FlgD